MLSLQYNVFFHGRLVLLHIAHVTSTLNCQWLVGGRSSSTLHMSLQLSTADGQWGGGPSSMLHMSLQLSTASDQWEVGSSSTSHMSLQFSTANGQWGMAWYPPHFTSSQSHIIWMGWKYPSHLTNQVECASAVKPNWNSIAICLHSLKLVLVYYFQVWWWIMQCTALLDICQCSTLHCIMGNLALTECGPLS